MKLALFDMDEFVDINHLQEITSPVLFERGGIPNPNGLVSNEIFGVNIKSRKETFAYIDLGGHFFHPHVYKALKRVFRNVDKIINGEYYYSITKEGELVKDELGETGIEFLYENWNKIKWTGNGGMSSERTDLLSKSKKNEIFITKEIVIPAFYRDISSDRDGGGKVPEVDNLYSKLIRMSALIKEKDMFDFSFHSTNYNIQTTLVAIYDYFKDKLDGKNGLFRKYLLGKNVDYCVRSVITAPSFNEENPENNIVDYQHTAIPISQACVLCYPFIVAWVKDYFVRDWIEDQYSKIEVNVHGDETNKFIQVKDPESYFTDTYIKKHIDKFIKDPSSRFDPITVPTTLGKDGYISFRGRYGEYDKSQSSSITNRPLTWTDLLYMACCDVTQDKHAMVTRYPLLDSFGFFIAKINISSTLKVAPATINNKTYKWYPVIDPNMSKEDVSNFFIDSLRFSNAYLEGMDGDYDGDQVTIKIFWTQEANEECKKVLESKSSVLGADGRGVRTFLHEGVQTLYSLTKD